MTQLTSIHIEELKRICKDNVFTNVCLANISRWKIGGKADCVVRPERTADIANLISYLICNKLSYTVIGSTSNLLFSDEGVKAVIIQIGNTMSDYKINQNIVWVQAGKWVPGLARNVAQAGLSGIEHTAGIPGTIGGLICMNGGSQRKGIGTHVKTLTAVSPSGEIIIFNNGGCKFGYRSSVFQQNNCIIVEAELELKVRRDYSKIRNEMLEILRTRRAKFPQSLPNCGSTFISNPEIYKKYGPPGAVIEELGYKGVKKGGAMVSVEHANFINNEGDAKASDVLYLIKKIKDDVLNKTGFEMNAEVKYVDEFGNIKPAHLV